MSLRTSRVRAATCLAAVAGLTLLTTPADAAPSSPAASVVHRTASSDEDAPKGYLLATLPDLDTFIETTSPGSIAISPGAKTAKVGQEDLEVGFVIQFKDGNRVTYGIQERIGGTWYDMASTTKTHPRDECAMGGPGWPVVVPPVAGRIKVRGFARENGIVVTTPAYTVKVKSKQ